MEEPATEAVQATLIQRLATRKRRFEEMVARETDSLYRAALTLARNRDDAEDLVQDTLIKAWRSFDSYREDGNARGWLITILYNAYRDRYRKQKRQPATTPLQVDDSYHSQIPVETGEPSAEGPEDEVLRQEISERILRAIRDLPPEFREPLLLVDLEGFTYGEAAEIMGVLKGTIMSRLHRARKRLGRDLAPYVAAESPGRRVHRRKRPGPEHALAKRRVINCGEACRHLHAYIDGLLDDEDRSRIDDHLALCRRCCDRFEFERRQRALLVAHHLGTTVPRAFLQRLGALIARFQAAGN